MKHLPDAIFWLGLFALFALDWWSEQVERRQCYEQGGAWVKASGCEPNHCGARK